MATEAERRAIKKYQEKTRIQKPLAFNRNNEEEMRLLAYAERQGGFQTYIKRLIREDYFRQISDGHPSNP